MLSLWTVWLFWNLSGVQGGRHTPALPGILLQLICSWNLCTRDGPLFTYACCCLNHPLASPMWNEYWERRLLAANSFNRTILLLRCPAYSAHGWEKWSSLLIPLAADTPVYPGGAVVFHSQSLALSLAGLFEKAMERERERERERDIYIYSSRQKSSVFYPWEVCYTVELDEMSVWKMLQVSQFDPQNLSMVGPLVLGILRTLSAVIWHKDSICESIRCCQCIYIYIIYDK